MAYGNRRHIPQAAKEQIVTTSAHMKPNHISRVTGISARTTRRTMELRGRTGRVRNVPIAQGKNRNLTALDLAFLEGCIE
ncbi:hypothetical protein PAXRUDRAFT_99808, partial [Paxillus rubicundulus Ve08.2h10]